MPTSTSEHPGQVTACEGKVTVGVGGSAAYARQQAAPQASRMVGGLEPEQTSLRHKGDW